MAKKKCKGGACALKNLPKPNPSRPAAAINTAALGTAPAVQPRAYQAVSGLGQGIPQQYNPAASLANQVSPLQQFGQQPVLQQLNPVLGNNPGPLQGLTGVNYGNRVPQASAQGSIPIPVANQQNTAIPQGQVLHRSGKQRGAVGRFFLGSRPEVFNNPNFTPYQSEALNYLLQYGLTGLQDLENNQFDFAPIGNQELERFYTQTIPSLAERFTALGGGQRSSAFQGALANAGRYLGNDLAAQQQQYNIQQQGQEQNLITNLLSMGLAPQFSPNLNVGSGGALGGLIKGGTQLAKTALTGGF